MTLWVDAANAGAVMAMDIIVLVAVLSCLNSGIYVGSRVMFGLASRGDAPAILKKITDVLVAGTIWVNCFFVRDLRAPFGGSKKSGIGRDGGTWSFDFYADVKNTVVSPNGWKE